MCVHVLFVLLPLLRFPNMPSFCVFFSVCVCAYRTAEAYRDHLFKVLWRACFAFEQPSLAVEPHQCLMGRQTALGVLLGKGASWDVDVFVAHAHRATVALERIASGSSSIDNAAQLSVFCLKALSDREGAQWPAGDKVAEFHPTWVDWLQHAAGLQDKIGDGAEAQRLLQLAYEYVRRCSKRQMAGARDYVAAECAAYASMLKMHAAATITSQCPLARRRESKGIGTVTLQAGKQGAKKRLGKRAADSPSPSSVVRAHTYSGLEYLGSVSDSLEVLATAPNGSGELARADATAFVGAAVKAWRWTQKSCSVTALWVDEVGAGGDAAPGDLEAAEWLELNVRGLRALGDLSRTLAASRRHALGDLLERMPPLRSISELAIDSYLRAAQAHLAALTSATPSGSVTYDRAGRRESEGISTQDAARQALFAAEHIYEVDGDVLQSQSVRRAGAGWFSLGKSLLDGAKVETGLDALVRGCRLLERWTEAEAGLGSHGHRDGAGVSDILRSAQLDLRLSQLGKALEDIGECRMAAAAAARALAFCPELWIVSSDGQPESPSGVMALVERYVTLSLRHGCSGSPQSRERGRCGGWSKQVATTGRAATASAETARLYILGSDSCSAAVGSRRGAAQDLSGILERQGIPSAVISWVLLAACRVYHGQLPLYSSEGEGSTTGEDGGVRPAFIEGHRLATEAVLEICERRPSEVNGVEDGLGGAALWEAHARIVAARFEHDLFLADVAARREGGTAVAPLMADLPSGIRHAAKGVATASRLRGEAHRGHFPAVAAAAGVCACIRAMLLRDLAARDDNFHHAMRQGLDFFDKAAGNSDWRPEPTWSAALRPASTGSIVDSLKTLENHYSLHGDTLRRARAADLSVVLVDRANAERETASSARSSAISAAALGSIGAAFHAAGLPALGPIYSAAADDKLRGLSDTKRRGVSNDMGTKDTRTRAQIEAARVAGSVLRGLCLAAQSGGQCEGERTVLEARRAASERSGVLAPVTAAYLECMAGMGLSWMYERSGRLVDAMGELKQVLRLCHSWASASDIPSVSDKQVVLLSAAKGSSIFDERLGGQAAAVTEEGVGEEGGDVEEMMKDKRSGEDGREREGVALSSRWIPIYLEGLTRMGRLWRARGVASKASGYLRQGCVASEPLRSGGFLRHCLLEAMEVATGMRQFDRADRLLRVSQDLLHRQRRELVSAEDGTSPECTTCRILDPANRSDPGHAPRPAKGKVSRRGAKKGGGKAKPASAPTVAVHADGPCIYCRELALSRAELAVAEAALLRKQGDFRGALAACEQGQMVLAPLIRTAGRPVPVTNLQSLVRVSSKSDPRARGGEGRGIGWRALEVLTKLRLQQGRAAYLLENITAAETLFQDCANEDGAPVVSRAAAFYRLGRMRLDAGDASGSKPLLERAETLLTGAGVPKLVRKVRRVLAVALTEVGCKGGPESVGVDGSWRVAALANLSIGVTHCNQVTHASVKRVRRSEGTPDLSDVSAGLRLFDVVSSGCTTLGGATAGGHDRRNGELTALLDMKMSGCYYMCRICVDAKVALCY